MATGEGVGTHLWCSGQGCLQMGLGLWAGSLCCCSTALGQWGQVRTSGAPGMGGLLFQVSPGSPISLVMTQLASTVSVGGYSPCAFGTSSLFSPATSSIQVHPGVALSSLFAREGAIDLALFQESCSRPAGVRPGAAATLIPTLVPGILSSQSNLLTI